MPIATAVRIESADSSFVFGIGFHHGSASIRVGTPASTRRNSGRSAAALEIEGSKSHGASGDPHPQRRDAAAIGRCRRHRRRHRRDQRSLQPRQEGAFGRGGGEGLCRRRAVEPELGLVPPAESRPARAAAGHARRRDVGRAERGARRRDRLPPHRSDLCDDQAVRPRRLDALGRRRARDADAQPHAVGQPRPRR